ncbi:parietopsin [Trichomycterus rosablanca]|uniref:parietopsin n=1 Tax=Trichomycterus rosablanca TaxID=2290929 RepID=UPI002F353E21
MNDNFTYIWGHVNKNTWQNNLQIAFLITSCTVLLLTFFIGIVANLFVTYAVYYQKSLQTSTNALLVNLALIDLLRCTTDCPLLLVVVLSGHISGDIWDFFCNAQVMSFSLISCVQLLTLACISAERHQAIANPFKSTERRKRVKAWIPLTWAVAFIVSGLCITFTKDSPVYIRCKGLRIDELKTYDSFGFYILLPVWSACLAFIIGFYSHIFILVRTHNRKIFDKGVLPLSASKAKKDQKKVTETVPEPAAPNETDNPCMMQELNMSAVKIQPCTEALEIQTVAENQPVFVDTNIIDVKTPERLDQPNQPSVTFVSELHPDTTKLIDLEHSEKTGNAPNDSPDKNSDENPSENHGDPSKSAGTSDPAADNQNAPADQTMEVMGAVCMMPSLANREQGKKKKEGKLAKRSGYIIFTFLFFWMPLIGTILHNAFINIHQGQDMEIIQGLEVLAVSIACMTSLTNPIIYAAVNPQFRTEFFNLKMRCKVCCTKP